MQTVTLIPSAVRVCAGKHDGRDVGEVIFVGSGSTAHITLQVMIDLAALGALEAQVGHTRSVLVAAASAA